MYYTGDPIRDFENYDRDLERELRRLPCCAKCGERIQDDECWEIDGEIICTECLEDNYRRFTNDLIEE